MDKLKIEVDSEISLRTWAIDDVQELFELIQKNKVYLNEWLPWVPTANTLEDTRKFIEGALKQYENGSGLELGIFYDDKIVGAIGLHLVSRMHNKTSIGYWLGEEYQGKGIMTKSVITMINYCFEKLGMNRIEIKVATGNEKSNAIPVKLGFTKEGVMREAEKLEKGYVDWNLYSLLRKEWEDHLS